MKNVNRLCAVLICSIAFIFIGAIHAQAQVVTGTPAFGSFAGGPDVINLANMNDHWDFPIYSRAGRGIPFHYALSYDSSIWNPVSVNGQTTWQPVNGTQTTWGWQQQSGALTGYMTYSTTAAGSCGTLYSNWVYHDPTGTEHALRGIVVYSSCSPSSVNGTIQDGSGYSFFVDNTPRAFIYPSGGGGISVPLQNPNGSGFVADANGNAISTTGTTFTDTVCTDPSCSSGSTALAITGNAPNPVYYAYTAPNGGTVWVTVTYHTYNVRTTFCAPGIADTYLPSTPLVDKITYPDSTYYAFTYEQTPWTLSGCSSPVPNAGDVTGRIASVRLPTGGSITYNYHDGNGYNGIWTDGSTTGFDRVVNDGTNSYTWSYNINNHVNTVTDPSGNQTLHTFSGLYETKRAIYQGSSSGQLLKTVINCYNGTMPSGSPPNWNLCINDTVTAPITRTVTYPLLPAVGNQYFKWAAVVDDYDPNSGLQIDRGEYDWTTGTASPPVRQTFITYASFADNPNLVGRHASVIVKDGNNTIVSQTNYSYDQTAVTVTSGTPQHTPVNISRGNLTQVDSWVTGSTYLHKYMSYYDTGTPNTVTDINGAVTTYNYGTNLAANCGNAFPTSVSPPTVAGITLTTSTTWNCSGAVASQTTDPNNGSVTTLWDDVYFWRPHTVTDPLGIVTYIGYVGATTTESALYANSGNSITTAMTVLDGLGRPHLGARRQGPSGAPNTTFDTVESDYDSNGRSSRGTMPYVSSGGVSTSSTAQATTTTYDALNRPLLVTDAAGGWVQYTYGLNDVLIEIGPHPTGETTKPRQYEYDGLGRLISVCEVTSGAGSGPCGQSYAQTGYLTLYTYDTMGRLTGVTQNAQSGGTPQTRSFSYDGLGRMLSEANPETGTVHYTYDYDATCGANFTGDLVKRLDNAGNVTCYGYDQLHRLTGLSYPSGPNAANTPRKFFLYDSATYNSIPMANAKGRLVTAITCPNSGTCNWTTWQYFSYTARGELAETWSTTPNAAGVYHLTQSYWEHGAPKQLSGLPGLPTITYGGTGGLDGEGRVTQVAASTGVSPVNSVSYNNTDPSASSEPLGALLSVNLGTTSSGQYDSDSFTYYPNTGRLHTYQFSMNSQTDTGTLTWNANGSLQQLAINDSIPGTVDSQTCNYTHDDLGRIATANCGTGQNQTFGYDPLGNITKTANVGVGNFIVGYNQATNRISNTGYTYDNNGNLLTDATGSHQYSWDAEGRPTCVDGVVLTYDASGRAVEQAAGGTCTSPGTSYKQVVYGPGGGKLALMSGQTLTKAFVPLPGGATAVYSSSGLAYYRHTDWLGSSRLASTPSRTLYSETAYAPFGENYAGSGTTDLSFTGQNQDTVSGLYDFTFRKYSSGQGRWISPDPAGLGAADPTDPQSWNRYAYVVNNPLSLVDPLGLWHACSGSSNCYDPSSNTPPFGWAQEFGSSFGFSIGGYAGGGSTGGLFGETLGIPNWLPFPQTSLFDFLPQLPHMCDFGPCSGFPGNGWQTSGPVFEAAPPKNDPTGTCVYLNAQATEPDPNGIDPNSTQWTCQGTGGSIFKAGIKLSPDSRIKFDPDTGHYTIWLSEAQCNQMNQGLTRLGILTTLFGGVTKGFWGGATAGVGQAGAGWYVNRKLCGGPPL